MTLAKKKRRKIVVGDQTYFWQATGNDDVIYLCVTGEVQGCQKLLTRFDYHWEATESAFGKIYDIQFVVTPYIVRRVIEYALAVGWKPFVKDKDLQLNVEDKIDLRLDENKLRNVSKSWFEFSLYAAGIKDRE